MTAIFHGVPVFFGTRGVQVTLAAESLLFIIMFNRSSALRSQPRSQIHDHRLPLVLYEKSAIEILKILSLK